MKNNLIAKGIGLLELMLVLAIIAIMTVSAVRYFSIANKASKLGQAMEMVSAVRTAGERWKATQENYSLLSTDWQGFKSLIERGFLPDIYQSQKNPWGGMLSAAPNTDPTKLDIIFVGVPTKADCSSFANKIESIGCAPNPVAASCTDGSQTVKATC